MKRERMRQKSRFGHGGRVIAALAVAGLTVSCADQGTSSGSGGGGGEGLPEGASMEDYIAAFEDIDPIEMTLQSVSAQGSPGARPYDVYAAALEEWSGGKIQTEVAYSQSIAPLPEVGEALADGRLDFARHAPLYQPDEFPESNRMVDLTFVGEHTAVAGRFQRMGAFLETSRNSTEIMEELEGVDLVPAFPMWPVTPMVVMACTDVVPVSLESMEGLSARGSGRIHARQLEALGVTPTDLTITEIYDGLQRGVIDCGEMALATLDVVGGTEIANKVAYGVEHGFADTPGAYSFGAGFWEELPLPAQQLLWDKLDVFVSDQLKSQIEQEVEALEKLQANGGVVEEWEPEVQEELGDFNQTVLDEAAEANPELVADLEESIESWGETVSELGIEDGGPFGELPQWYSEDDLHLDEFMEKFQETVLAPGRPS